MNFKMISDRELIAKLKNLVVEERKITTEILRFLKEVEARRLYATWGYPSLFEFCTKELGYSASASQRRIESMRLLKSMSETEVKSVEEKLNAGHLNLTQLSMLQTFVRHQEKVESKKIRPEKKIEWLHQLENHSTRDCEKILQAIEPLHSPLFSKEKERSLGDGRTELKFSISNQLLKKLERIREIRAHQNPKMTYEDLLEYLAEVALQKIDPERRVNKKAPDAIAQKITSPPHPEFKAQITALKRGEEKSSEYKADKSNVQLEQWPATLLEQRPAIFLDQKLVSFLDLKFAALQEQKIRALPAPEVPTIEPLFSNPDPLKQVSRHIPTSIKRKVWHRDKGCCTFVSPETGRKCASRFGLEFEHIHPFALGGHSTEENLTLHCKSHNLTQAFKKLGENKMRPYLK